MSILNKMHQGLEAHQDDSPILSSMPSKKQKKSVLLFIVISLLLASSITLSYLIYEKESSPKMAVQDLHVQTAPVLNQQTELQVIQTPPVVVPAPAVEVAIAAPVKAIVAKVEPKPKPESVASIDTLTTEILTEPSAQTVLTRPVATVPVAKPVARNLAEKKSKVSVVTPPTDSNPHLEIKTSVLSTAELADIHLNNAKKALQKGDNALAATHNMKALNLQPQLHGVRQSLALYYYGIDDQKQAIALLQKGALQFPEHADFNLMLARISLKNSDPQRAYFYLHQSPPEVEGNMDYHVSYAILAQKFKHYGQAEQLYLGLLSQRPNNGRWLMSLAIAQDKQGKEVQAVQSYQSALLQVDLSSNAKKYINQRLTYLANQ